MGFNNEMEKTGKPKKRVQVHVPYPMLVERLDEVIDVGINPEVYMDGEDLEGAGPEELKRIKEVLDRYDRRITLHGPFMDLNPGSADEGKRLRTVAMYKRAFEAASYLRPKVMVLHAGFKASWFDNDVGLWLEKSLKTWPEFVKRAEDMGITIAAENTFEREPGPIKRLVEEIGSPSFRLCIDSGHLNVYSEVEIEEWFRVLGAYVAEVHLHDNFGAIDDHLPIGDGTIDFAAFFRLLKTYSNDPVYTIEPHGEEVLFRAIDAVMRYI